MKVRFWGTRGSIPAALGAAAVRRKIVAALRKADGRKFATDAELDAFVDGELDFATRATYGGNSSCVELDSGGDEYVICDLGSGLRELGNAFLKAPHPGKKKVFNIFQSHLHWDHIMGFPFFIPAYIPGHTIRIHSCHDLESVVREAFRRQQSAPCFPVDFGQLGATIEFVQLEAGKTYGIAGLTVKTLLQHHSGDSYGYRFEKDGKAFVYSTDSEHQVEKIGPDYPFIGFFREADLVVFDAMYSLADAMSVKEDWGHSSNILGVELCLAAGVRRLAMFHHEPIHDDAAVSRILEETRRFEEISRQDSPLEVITAWDGLEIEL